MGSQLQHFRSKKGELTDEISLKCNVTPREHDPSHERRTFKIYVVCLIWFQLYNNNITVSTKVFVLNSHP